MKIVNSATNAGRRYLVWYRCGLLCAVVVLVLASSFFPRAALAARPPSVKRVIAPLCFTGIHEKFVESLFGLANNVDVRHNHVRPSKKYLIENRRVLELREAGLLATKDQRELQVGKWLEQYMHTPERILVDTGCHFGSSWFDVSSSFVQSAEVNLTMLVIKQHPISVVDALLKDPWSEMYEPGSPLALVSYPPDVPRNEMSKAIGFVVDQFLHIEHIARLYPKMSIFELELDLFLKPNPNENLVKIRQRHVADFLRWADIDGSLPKSRVEQLLKYLMEFLKPVSFGNSKHTEIEQAFKDWVQAATAAGVELPQDLHTLDLTEYVDEEWTALQVRFRRHKASRPTFEWDEVDHERAEEIFADDAKRKSSLLASRQKDPEDEDRIFW